MQDVNIARKEPLVDIVGFRLSWGAIFAGFVVATVIQVVLSVLGIAIGFTAWSPGAGDTAWGGVGIGTAVWFAATAIISLFVGGLVLGRLAGILKKKDGMLHGTVMWGLSTLLAVWMVANGVGMFVGTTFNTLGRTAGAVVAGSMTAAGEVGAAAIQRPGQIDDVTERAQQRLETVQDRVDLPSSERVMEEAGAVADTGADVLAATAWLTLLVMALSLGAAVWGSAMTAND